MLSILFALKFDSAKVIASKLMSVAVTLSVSLDAYIATIPVPVPISKTLCPFFISKFIQLTPHCNNFGSNTRTYLFLPPRLHSGVI